MGQCTAVPAEHFIPIDEKHVALRAIIVWPFDFEPSSSLSILWCGTGLLLICWSIVLAGRCPTLATLQAIGTEGKCEHIDS
ncbi:hypothetical protein Patl1_11356 [Pistacia atlantica]|uniref:Uncharacterized protein n=1 Tax=Pistacia atlantica TaxID=434234 RepID=A0ACC1A581_9ROSI|nr:hypothetical protein Patl1_11356 [Pistacia atlantica]